MPTQTDKKKDFKKKVGYTPLELSRKVRSMNKSIDEMTQTDKTKAIDNDFIVPLLILYLIIGSFCGGILSAYIGLFGFVITVIGSMCFFVLTVEIHYKIEAFVEGEKVR